MNITTTYLGLKLTSPIIAAASPISKDLDAVRKAAEAGAGAIVMYSLFEEQIMHEKQELDHFLHFGTDSYAEALNYFPQPQQFNNLNAEDYLEQISKIKREVEIPVIGSLNGVSPGGWMEYARKMQEAGADAIELNIYYVPTDPNLGAHEIESMYIDNVRTTKQAVDIPVALKLSPFFTAFANFASRLDRETEVDGLVLFNRFFGPEIDLEELEVVPKLTLSTPQELPVPLRWIAVLYGKVNFDMAASSGVHSGTDALKALLVGAKVVQVASVLLKHGPSHMQKLVSELKQWMEDNEYESVDQLRGSMSYRSVAEPAAFERANYMKILQSYE